MKRRIKKNIIFNLLLVLFISLFSCESEEEKFLGLNETPEMLYKSFRAVNPRAYSGPAPDLAADVDLSSYFPQPGDQGMIGSCTAWTTAYAAKSFHENIERGWGANSDDHKFSPSYIYNQINGGVDQGSALEYAIALVIESGCATLDTMPYTENYTQQPSRTAHNEAIQYKAVSFSRININDLEAVKSVLLNGNAVLIGMEIYENFMDYSGGVYNRISGAYMGGHAMCVIGYDNAKGAFKLINSWSTYWGEGGYGWISYDIFQQYVVTCLVMYDEVTYQPEVAEIPINVEASQGSFPDKIEVTWEQASNANSYKIYRSDNPREYFAEIGNTRGNLFIDENLEPGVSYYYAVTSISYAGETELSESAEGYSGIILTEVGVPQNVQSLFSDGAVYLGWDEMSGIDGFYVYRFEVENFILVGSTENPNFRDVKEFANNEVLWYIVTAYRNDIESEPSSSINITVEIYEEEEEQEKVKDLRKPKNVIASEGDYEDRVIINWDTVEGADKFSIFRWDEDDENWIKIGETESNSFEDDNITETSGYYMINAVNEYAVSELSDSVFGYTSEYQKEIEVVEYDDDEYFDDTEFEDTDFKDEDLYNDDNTDIEEEIIFDDFPEDEVIETIEDVADVTEEITEEVTEKPEEEVPEEKVAEEPEEEVPEEEVAEEPVVIEEPEEEVPEVIEEFVEEVLEPEEPETAAEIIENKNETTPEERARSLVEDAFADDDFFK
jgi:C1A family cysteine protease